MNVGATWTAFGNSRGVRRLEGRKLFWPEVVRDILAGGALARVGPKGIWFSLLHAVEHA